MTACRCDAGNRAALSNESRLRPLVKDGVSILDHSSTDPAALTAAFAGMGVGLVFILALVVFSVFIYWKIATKAGYNGAMSLLLFVPIANLIVICLFAFTEWPIEKALKAATGGGGMWPPGPPAPPMWTPPSTQPPPSAGPYLPPGS